MKIDSRIAPNVISGKTALVTGAGRGNGRSIAIGLAMAGAEVIVTDIDKESAYNVSQEIISFGFKSQAFQLDVTSEDQCKFVASHIERLDILVNNAGIIIRKSIYDDNPVECMNMMLNVNTLGVFIPTYIFLKHLKKTKGKIINIASIASFVGLPNSIGYSPSKGAVKLLTQSLAVELAKDGIRVNAVAPGVIETPMTEITRNSPENLERFMTRTPLKRVGKPDELIGPVIFLASDMSSYVTGATIIVDGGFLA